MAVKSLQSQSLDTWEALIVDDGSTQEELEEIRRTIAGEPRIRLVLRDAPPQGANHCRNIGIQLARSDLMVFLDSDDMFAPTSLETRVNAMRGRSDLSFGVFPHRHFRDQPGDMSSILPMRR